MSQIFEFCPEIKTKLANRREFEEMLEFEENTCICYRFYPYGCFIFPVLWFSLTGELNCPSPEFCRGAALFSEYAEILEV